MLCSFTSILPDAFLLDLIIISLVLIKLIESLLTSHHTLTFPNLELINVSRFFKSRAEAKRFVSSANILKVRVPEQLGRSLIY